MTGGIIGGALATHSPRMAAQEPAFMAELACGARQMGERLREARPDVLVVQSAHWLTTFSWYVTCQPVHEGQCVASEAPDLIPGLPYRRRGDPDFAAALVEAIAERGVPARRNETPYFVWDYGSLVPLLYADPEAELPVVLLGTCMAATLEECLTAGEALRAAAQAADRRVLFIASGALSHALVRGPEQWPTPERRQLDHHFIDLPTPRAALRDTSLRRCRGTRRRSRAPTRRSRPPRHQTSTPPRCCRHYQSASDQDRWRHARAAP